MLYLLKSGKWLPTHPLGGRVGSNELRILLFQFRKLVLERIKCGIRNLLSIEHMIQIPVAIDLFFEFLYAFFRRFFGHMFKHIAFSPKRKTKEGLSCFKVLWEVK